MPDTLSSDDGRPRDALPSPHLDYYDKLISSYAAGWPVTGDGPRRTPYTDHTQEFWEQRVRRLIDAGLLVPSGLARDLTALTNAELKELCASYGLVKSGRKAQLVERLVDHADLKDLRAVCPGPYWVPAEAFQKILATDMEYVHYLQDNHLQGIDPVAFDEKASGMSTAQWHDLLWSHMEAAKLKAAEHRDHTTIRAVTADQAHLLRVENRHADQFWSLVHVCAADLTDSSSSITEDAAAMLVGDVPNRQLAPGLITRMRNIVDDQGEFTRHVTAGLERWDATRSPFTIEEMVTLMVDAAFGDDLEETRQIYRQCGERHRHLLYTLSEDDWETVVWLCETTIELDGDKQPRSRNNAAVADPPEQRQQALVALQADVAAHRQH